MAQTNSAAGKAATGAKARPARSATAARSAPAARAAPVARAGTGFEPVAVPLAKLVRHVRNVRAARDGTGEEAAVARLAANIRAVGLLQPLLVAKTADGYGVLAGGRRLAALGHLAADATAKGFGPRMAVPCLLVPEGAPLTALSLLENEMQVPMDPLERHEAFAALRDADGLDIAGIARVFGVTERLVRETLRIGLVAPAVRAAYREGGLDLEALRAFAAHPDPAVKADIHASLAQAGPVRAWQVRSALGARGVRQGDALGAFVLEGYRAAGGTVAANLIAEDSVLEDGALVRRVQAARLDDIAGEECARLGLAWSGHRVDPDWEEMATFGRVHPGPKDLDAETQARVAALEGELEQVADEMDALAGGPQDDATDAAWDALDARCDAIRETLCDLTLEYSAPDAGIGGVIAVWQHGGVRLERGLVRPEDMPQAPGWRWCRRRRGGRHRRGGGDRAGAGTVVPRPSCGHPHAGGRAGAGPRPRACPALRRLAAGARRSRAGAMAEACTRR